MAGATQAAWSGALAERLETRRPEIEQEILTRVYAVEDPADVGNPEYALGLRAAVPAALSYGITCLGVAGGPPPPVPDQLLAQVRSAAHCGVNLDTVLRRYFAGYTLLCDCLLRETERGGAALERPALRRMLCIQGSLFDRLIVAITDAYVAEAGGRLRTADHRRAERVKRLLRGELVDPSDLGYELESWHLGIAAAGPRAPGLIRHLAASLDRRLLLVLPGGETTWAWLGGLRRIGTEDLVEVLEDTASSSVTLAVGEPAWGLTGWRQSHRQAVAALPVALRPGDDFVRYADVALLAASLQDEILAGSLWDLYLAPLLEERDGGEVLRQTTRAYFAANRNVSAAAAALQVSRPTIRSRLRTFEERIGRCPDEHAAEIETALRLYELIPVEMEKLRFSEADLSH